MTPRRFALLAFPKLTFLDLIGVYDALRRVAPMGVAPGVSVTIVGTEPEVADDSGLVVRAQAVYPALAGYDMLFVPGGVGTRALMHDARFVEDGRVVTAGGVASSLDLGLYLVEKYWSAAAREKLAAQMEYTGYRTV